MTCDNCIYCKACSHFMNTKEQIETMNYGNSETWMCFEDKTLFVKLPFCVGTTVYTSIGFPEVFAGTVLSFAISETLEFYVRYTNGLTYWHRASDIGKEIFLTREEAEEAIRNYQAKHQIL